jgi:hypothetical protein
LVVEFSLRRIPFKQWRHPQFQAPEIRVGEDCLMKFVSIRVHSWLRA